MITIYNNIISEKHCDEFIKYYEENPNKIIKTRNDLVYYYDGIYITDELNLFGFTNKFSKNEILKIRIQHVDNTINMLETPHGHSAKYNFVAFLNDNFNGGELIFDNISIKPQKGQLIYFTGNEQHYVKNVINGNRYSLIGMSMSHIDILKSSLL